MRDLRARRDAAVDADLVEVRLDSVPDPDVAAALEGRQHPVLVTCRPAWEGGGFRGSEEERRRLLAAALDLGAEYVDIEWRAGFDDLVRRRNGQGIVLSMHEFGPAPHDLGERFRVMRATGAEIVKVAISAEGLADTLPLLDLSRSTGSAGHAVLVAMGPAGLATRILAAHFGSRWTYAGSETAIGQMPVERLLREFRFRSVSARTAIYGIVGRPIGHSVSPAMHNAGFTAAGCDAVYVPLAARDMVDFVAFARTVGLSGVSVTAPFKVDAFHLVDEADEASRRIGALNSIKAAGTHWMGRNTDVAGFQAPLEGRVDVTGLRAAVLGAGGGARAAVLALVAGGARVTLYARNLARALDASRATGADAAPWPPPPGSWDLLVNATPVGMDPDTGTSPMAGRPLDGRLVYDLVYNPERTRLLADAEAAGCHTIGGLPMVVEQARRQFAWWTGVQADARVFEVAARGRLAQMFAEASPEAIR
jgi:3-dehydroquinate dehydratase/shikimate dehydrogenase